MEAAGALVAALRELKFSFDGDESMGAFMAWAGRARAFPGLQRLEVHQEEDASMLGAALAAGAFASLQELRFEASREVAVDFTRIRGMEALVQGLTAATCARTLRSFVIDAAGSIGGGGWFSSLGEAMGAGQLPALAEIETGDKSIRDEAAVLFASSLTAAGSQGSVGLFIYHDRR
jgi:hypothetical protein